MNINCLRGVGEGGGFLALGYQEFQVRYDFEAVDDI
jgi:hypothetical protein